MESLLAIAVVFMMTAFGFTISFLVLRWVYNDAEEHGYNGWLIAGLVLLSNLFGILIWLVVRDNLTPQKETAVNKS